MMSEPTSAARAEMLLHIRAAKQSQSSLRQAGLEWQQISRAYGQPARPHEQMLALLVDRLRDYDAHVERIASSSVPTAILRVLTQRGHPRMVVPPGVPPELLPHHPFVMDNQLTPAELDRIDGVLTTATLAIAETGTIVLQNAIGQGRRALTLVPDFHLCLVSASSVVDTVPTAFARLAATSALSTTFISGPSATADIEMTRIKGVHGPRFLHVLLMEDEA